MNTQLSSKGQIVLPKSVRDAHRWVPGTKFTIEDSKDGILLRPVATVASTRIEDVVGCLGYRGPVKTIEEMDVAVMAEAKRHAR
jgi:AbrB family looped-hinge helix DNA binding protein